MVRSVDILEKPYPLCLVLLIPVKRRSNAHPGPCVTQEACKQIFSELAEQKLNQSIRKINLIEPILRALSAEGYTQPIPSGKSNACLVRTQRPVSCAQTVLKNAALRHLFFSSSTRTSCMSRVPMESNIDLTPPWTCIQIGEALLHTEISKTEAHGHFWRRVSKISNWCIAFGRGYFNRHPGRAGLRINVMYTAAHQNICLDEADRNADMGFILMWRNHRELPSKRQTLFSRPPCSRNFEAANTIPD